MAAEIVETTRLYARTVARIDPAWALDLGAHLLKVSHTEPFWNAEAGRVLVKRRARLYGLELESRAVGYGKIDPVHATEIFIREGLVNDTITWPFDFLAHNRRVRDKVEIVLTRTRSSGYLNLDEAIYRFYAARLLPAGAAVPSSPAKRHGRGWTPPGARGGVRARAHRSGPRAAPDRPEVPVSRGRRTCGVRGGGARRGGVPRRAADGEPCPAARLRLPARAGRGRRHHHGFRARRRRRSRRRRSTGPCPAIWRTRCCIC